MGSLISSIFGGGESEGQAGQMAAMQQSRDAAHAYRPEAMQARLNLLSKASGAYQGMNNALETMYGGRGPKVGGGPQGGIPPQPTFGGHALPQGGGPMFPEGRPTTGPGSQPTPGGEQGFNPMMLLDPANIFGAKR
jgi:hypothetical protein